LGKVLFRFDFFITFALSKKAMEIARQAEDFIALAKQKNLPGQAAKRHPFGDMKRQTYV